MRIIHLSDTHLGFSEYYKTDPETGLNQREQDFYNAWEQAVDSIISLQPDLVLHAGDLFHTPRPNNRAIRVALEGIQRISTAGIPMVIISGNHETPRIRTTGSIFESLTLFPNVQAVYESRYECHIVNSVAVHCLPHCSLTEELEAAIAAIAWPAEGKYHVLLTHGAWSGGSYGMGEFNEQRLPDMEAATGRSFDYIALGHYHKQIDICEHICYSGSTERTSLSQSENGCGFLEVNLFSGAKRFHALGIRSMIRLPALNCRDFSKQEIYQHAESFSRTCPAGSVVQLSLYDVNPTIFLQMDMRDLETLFSHTLHLEKNIRLWTADDRMRKMGERIKALPIEFGHYLESAEDIHLDKIRLLQLSQNYLGV